MDLGRDRLDPHNRDRFPNYQTHDTPAASDRAESSDTGGIDAIARDVQRFVGKGWKVLYSSSSDKDKIYNITEFLEQRKQLEHRAMTGQLSHKDRELIKQIERNIAELQKLAEDIKKLNNSKQ